MAKKFGGKYSPGGASGTPEAVEAPRVDAAGARSNVMFVPGVIIAFRAIGSDPVALVTGLLSAGVLTLGAWLLREGLRAEAAYDARKIASRPALPRKMIATVLTGLGIALAGYMNGAGIVTSAVYGIAAAALHVAAFGIDPLKNKRMEGIDTFQQDRVARVVDEAEAHLRVMTEQVELLNDRALEGRVEQFQIAARRMIRTVEEDPRDLSGARKFLGVYLMGARDATIKFVDLARRAPDDSARADFEALLTDLETNFAAKTDKLLSDNRSDMDIEIKVLRDRLQREGVSLK